MCPRGCAVVTNGSVSKPSVSATIHPTVLHHMVFSSHQPHTNLLLSIEAERPRSPAAGSGREAGSALFGENVRMDIGSAFSCGLGTT
jgi:hypothetical protein